MVEPFQVRVAPVDDLRDEAVDAYEVLQGTTEAVPLVVGFEGGEAVQRRLEVLVQLRVQLAFRRVRRPPRRGRGEDADERLRPCTGRG